jgi:hypothetical protein
MATLESQKRSERRRRQKSWERFKREPWVVAFRHEIDRRQKYQVKHPYTGQPGLLYMHCAYMGIRFGGRARKARRCTKRLGTTLCWNWRVGGTDRCHRHGRQSQE